MVTSTFGTTATSSSAGRAYVTGGNVVISGVSSIVPAKIKAESIDLDALAEALKSRLEPGPVLIKCHYCGQWAAKFTACVHCGAAVG